MSLDDDVNSLPSVEPLKFTPYASLLDTSSADGSDYGTLVTDNGLQFVYDVTNWLSHALQRNVFPDYLISNDDMRNSSRLFSSFMQNYAEWIAYDQIIIVTGGVSLVIAAVFTLVSIAIACCRCFNCSNNEEKQRPGVDKKFDYLKRATLNCFLSIFTIIMIFAVATCFITNEYTHQAAKKLPSRLKGSVDDLAMYRDDVFLRFEYLLVNDYATFEQKALNILNGSADIVTDNVKRMSGAVALDSLAQISIDAENLLRNLSRLAASFGSVSARAEQLSNNVTRLAQEVLKNLDKGCAPEARSSLLRSAKENASCSSARQSLLHLLNLDSINAWNIGNNNVDFGDAEQAVARIAQADIAKKLEESRNRFEYIRTIIASKIGSHRTVAQRKFRDVGDELKLTAKDFSSLVSKFDLTRVKFAINEVEPGIDQVERYRWIACMVMIAVLAFAVLCIGFGLFFGICGKRPSYYEEDYCCNKSVGSKFFFTGIALGMFFVLLFMALTVSLFIIGTNVENIGCAPLQDNPEQIHGVLKLADRYAKLMKEQEFSRNPSLQDLLGDVTLRQIISGCQTNESLYSILKLERHLSLDKIKAAETKMSEELGDILHRVTELNFSIDIHQLISPHLQSELLRISAVTIPGIPPGLSKQLSEYKTRLNYGDFIASLQRIALEKGTLPESAKKALLRGLDDFKNIQNEQLLPLIDDITSLDANLSFINNSLATLTQQIPVLLNQAKEAEAILSSNLTGVMRASFQQFLGLVFAYVDQYFNHVIESVRTKLASCAPLTSIAKTAIVNICDRTVNPFNGLWAGSFVTLALFMPCAACAFFLRDMYLNTEAYPGLSRSGVSTSPSINSGQHRNRSRSHNRSRSNAYIRDYDDYYADVSCVYGRQQHANVPGLSKATPKVSAYSQSVTASWQSSVPKPGHSNDKHSFDILISPPSYNTAVKYL